MEIFHTGNYVRSHYNFRISGILGDKKPSPVVSALANIHFRGSPSLPSTYLKEQLNDLGVVYSSNAAVHFPNEYRPNWRKTILGGSGLLNPALDFFENTLPVFLDQFSFLYSLVKPEVPFSELIDGADDQFSKERVDFFIPLANIVIEIDGNQHDSSIASKIDRDRDKYLRKHSISVYRIKTIDLRDSEYIDKVKLEFNDKLKGSRLVKSYSNLLAHTESEASLIFTTIYRVQAIIIELLERNFISLRSKEWRFSVVSEIDVKYIELACMDIFNWIKILDATFVFPEIVMNSEHSNFTIDVSVKDRWDDETDKDGVISCRTDHFDYFPEGYEKNIIHKDYFKATRTNEEECLNYVNINLKSLLYQIFGYKKFNSGQIDIIEGVLQKNNTIGILPTGGGKSLCYQLPAILTSGLTVVICPIKSLMRDQVQELKGIGFHRSASIDGDTKPDEKESILKRVKKKKIRFLFVSPERLQISKFRDAILQLNQQNLINLIVVDEVHCMSEWGHDFRTSYLTLPSTLKMLAREVPLLCLTATASSKVLQDIQSEFSITDKGVKTLTNYKRDNLNFSVRNIEGSTNTINVVREGLDKNQINNNKAAIIFSSTVGGRDGNGAYDIFLNVSSITDSVGIFTGSAPKGYESKDYEEEKAKNQKLFKDNMLSILVATKAFGMGVNKRNVDTTIHSGLPQSIEALYQEAGRAGRGGQQANCIVLVNWPDQYSYDKFFGYKDFKEFQRTKLGRNSGDLSLYQYFLKKSVAQNFSVPDVVEIILTLLSSESEKGAEISVEALQSKNIKLNKEIIELSLYRLYQMGVVIDWTIEDFRRGIFLVDYHLYEFNHHLSVVSKLADDPLLYHRFDLAICSKLDWIERMKALAVELIEYHLRTRVFSRIESLKTLLLACSNYDPLYPDKFRENLESYFRVDYLTDSLAEIIDSNGDPVVIINYLGGGGEGNALFLQDSSSLTANLFPLRRYIESYPNNVALKFLNTLFLLHLNEKVDRGETVGVFSDYIKTLGDSRYIHFIKDLKVICSDRVWNDIDMALSSVMASSYDLNLYAKELDSDYATFKLINNLNKEVIERMGEFNELI